MQAARTTQARAFARASPYLVLPGAEAHLAGMPTSLAATRATAANDGAAEAFGRSMATALLTKFALTDELDTTVEPPLTEVPGEWRETGSGAALTPRWGRVPLWLLSEPGASANGRYVPATIPAALLNYPALLASDLYASNLAEVRSKGSATSATRTALETEIAFFWANDLHARGYRASLIGPFGRAG